MAVTTKVLIPPTLASSAQTTLYTADKVTTIIDKFTATNIGATAQDISVNLVSALGIPDNSNLIVKTKTLQPNESYTFPEIVGHILQPNNYISVIASTDVDINVRSSGREIS